MLERQHGGRPVQEPPRVSEFGVNFWRHAERWLPGEIDMHAYLYADTYRHLPVRAVVAVEDGQLSERLAEERARTFGKRELSEEVAAALRATHPAIAAALLEIPRERYGVTTPHGIIEQALQASSGAPASVKPALLLAAQELAPYLARVLPPTATPEDPSLRGFVAAGLTFESNPYDPGLRPTDNLLKVVRDRYANSRWGDRAALALLDTCDNDAARFQGVIKEGTAFLSSRRQSPYRLEFTERIAMAFETWWSLSRAVDDEFVDAAAYTDGAESARIQAIAWYERVIDLSPGSDSAFQAGRKIARLTLKVDTGQRIFSCPYP